MKQKKQKGLSSDFVVAIVAIILIVIWAVVISYLFRVEYNPEEDVCDECTYLIGDIELHTGNCNDMEHVNYKCVDWRPKSKCELNPNDEGCICDEYEDIVAHYKLSNKTTLVDWSDCERKGFCEIVKNDTHFIFNMSKEICLKAHEANECELNNPNWVWDTKCVEYTQLEAKRNKDDLSYTIYGRCVEEETICRKKTIYDFNCSKLREAIHKDWNFIVCDKGSKYYVYFDDFLFGKCYTEVIYRDEIYDIAVDKGCNI